MQTKASFSKRGQAREFAQFEALERRIERWAFPKIRKEMNNIVRDIVRDYQVGGVDRVYNIALNDGREKIKKTLEPIYDRTIKNSIKLLKKQNPNMDFEFIENDLRNAYRKHLATASNQIIDSTSREVKNIVDKNLTQKQTEKELSRKIRRSNRVRSKLISETEIGSITAEANHETYSRAAPEAVLKVWVTRRDSKVRDPHQFAEGQTVFKEENFIVGGESTPYPRHRGLSAKNRVNCRCRVRWIKV